jgi:uncharacterized protein YbaP (TraB family)
MEITYSAMYLYFWGMIPNFLSKISISARSLLIFFTPKPPKGGLNSHLTPALSKGEGGKAPFAPSPVCLIGRGLGALLLLISFSATAQYQSLCWRISGNGLEHPAYLYGTMHVSDKRVFNFGKKTRKAFAKSKAFAMELDPEKAMALTTLTKMIMSDGNKISKLIPDSDYHFLDSVIRLSTGMGMALFNTMEPIIVSAIIDEYGMGVSTMDSADTKMDEPMDLYFYKNAKKSKKKVIGIETVDEQIGAMHSLSYQEQADLLVQTIEDIKKGPKNSDGDLMKFYIEQDLDSLSAMNDKEPMPPKLYKAMVTDRNIRMADRIDLFIHKLPTFIAIGALHLPGPGGVIALLRKKGYTVEAWR